MDVQVEKGMTYNAPEIEYDADGDAKVDMSGSSKNGSNGGDIVGIYYNLDGQPQANVKIYITKSKFAVTDQNGRFEFKNIIPNTYKLYVQIDGEFYELRDVEVQAGRRISIKVMEPDVGYGILDILEEFFTEYTPFAILACVGVLVVIGGTVFLIIFLVKKKKKKVKNAA